MIKNMFLINYIKNGERTVYKKPLKYDTTIGSNWSKRSGSNTNRLVDGLDSFAEEGRAKLR